MRRYTCCLITMALAGTLAAGNAPEVNATTLVGLPYPHSVDAVGAVIGCMSCSSEFDPGGSPFPGKEWHVFVGYEQCEDGYSESGPCIYCTQTCDDEVDYWWDEDDCENFNLCEDTEQLALEVDKYVYRNDRDSLERLILSHPAAFRRDHLGAFFQLVACGGEILREFSVRLPIDRRDN